MKSALIVNSLQFLGLLFGRFFRATGETKKCHKPDSGVSYKKFLLALVHIYLSILEVRMIPLITTAKSPTSHNYDITPVIQKTKRGSKVIYS